ncbi:M15 family metallopeptidase [Streptomyces zingiberis]|uniref:D-alanyl-D-alanine dipeptidase n=1 Tax=Streptomyces zingiberis TaxID=2053010 RepID=A0ABX1C270_9ACTN|nr:M15 family metallopeptidase [Streptomyces zingiberis]NJQ03518.1 M15 family metallopeptidase [Streptomyces zingiberis]
MPLVSLRAVPPRSRRRSRPGPRPGSRRGGPRPGPAVAAALLLLLATGAPAAAAGTERAAQNREPRAPRDFTDLRAVAPTVLHDIRYTTRHNFTGVPVDGYREPRCLLTRPAAEALRTAQRHFLARGHTLKVYDCYRPQRAVDHFVRWAADPGDQRMKREFYPDVDKSRLFEDGYIAERSGHSRGSTVDLTLVKLPPRPARPYRPGEPLVPCTAPRDERFPDNSVDMGTGFDCFDSLSHTLDERIGGEQRRNRLLLKEGLERVGFVNYPLEWWHFTYQPEPFPEDYFDFPVDRRALAGPPHRP